MCFFPCNLTLGRDPLIGAASREGLAGILLGVVLVRWHCLRQGTEDAQEGVVRPTAWPALPPGGRASRASPSGPSTAVRVSGEAMGSRSAQTGYTIRWPLQGHRPRNDGAEIGMGALVPKALLLPGCQTTNRHPFAYFIFSDGRSSVHELEVLGDLKVSPVEARRSRDPNKSSART